MLTATPARPQLTPAQIRELDRRYAGMALEILAAAGYQPVSVQAQGELREDMARVSTVEQALTALFERDDAFVRLVNAAGNRTWIYFVLGNDGDDVHANSDSKAGDVLDAGGYFEKVEADYEAYLAGLLTPQPAQPPQASQPADSAEPVHGYVGSGTKIHLIMPMGHGRAICGSGEADLGYGLRRSSSIYRKPRLTKDPLTCPKCIAIQAKRDAAKAAKAAGAN